MLPKASPPVSIHFPAPPTALTTRQTSHTFTQPPRTAELYEQVIRPGRKSGWLDIRHGRREAFTSQWVSLSDGVLCCYASEQDELGRSTPLESVRLDAVTLSSTDSEPALPASLSPPPTALLVRAGTVAAAAQHAGAGAGSNAAATAAVAAPAAPVAVPACGAGAGASSSVFSPPGWYFSLTSPEQHIEFRVASRDALHEWKFAFQKSIASLIAALLQSHVQHRSRHHQHQHQHRHRHRHRHHGRRRASLDKSSLSSAVASEQPAPLPPPALPPLPPPAAGRTVSAHAAMGHEQSPLPKVPIMTSSSLPWEGFRHVSSSVPAFGMAAYMAAHQNQSGIASGAGAGGGVASAAAAAAAAGTPALVSRESVSPSPPTHFEDHDDDLPFHMSPPASPHAEARRPFAPSGSDSDSESDSGSDTSSSSGSGSGSGSGSDSGSDSGSGSGSDSDSDAAPPSQQPAQPPALPPTSKPAYIPPWKRRQMQAAAAADAPAAETADAPSKYVPPWKRRQMSGEAPPSDDTGDMPPSSSESSGLSSGDDDSAQSHARPTARLKYRCESCGSGKYGLFSTQGTRSSMEDAHTIIEDVNALLRFGGAGDERGACRRAFFAVFDGHSGSHAAEYAAEHLHKYAFADTAYLAEPVEAFRRSFARVDQELCAEANAAPDDRKLDCGTTALAVLIHDCTLMAFNLGDCRAVLSRSGTAHPVSADHTPQSERARIEASGGWVTTHRELCLRKLRDMELEHPLVRKLAEQSIKWEPVSRVCGELAVARALGDADYKDGARRDAYPWAFPDRCARPFTADLVSAVPDVHTEQLRPGDRLLVMACDGLWEVLTSEQVVELLEQFVFVEDLSPEVAAEKLVDLALKMGSSDNITCVVVVLQPKDKGARPAAAGAAGAGAAAAAVAAAGAGGGVSVGTVSAGEPARASTTTLPAPAVALPGAGAAPAEDVRAGGTIPSRCDGSVAAP